jgi:hypothetical protein
MGMVNLFVFMLWFSHRLYATFVDCCKTCVNALRGHGNGESGGFPRFSGGQKCCLIDATKVL